MELKSYQEGVLVSVAGPLDMNHPQHVHLSDLLLH